MNGTDGWMITALTLKRGLDCFVFLVRGINEDADEEICEFCFLMVEIGGGRLENGRESLHCSLG